MKNKNKDISFNKRPLNQGLYDSNFEHDACGIGFVANIKGNKENKKEPIVPEIVLLGLIFVNFFPPILLPTI